MILSFAQQLYIQFDDNDLAAMARESREKSVGAINYGNRDECDQLLDRILQRGKLIDRAAEFAELLQKRAKMLGAQAAFLSDTDTVPATGSVSTLYRIDSAGLVRESDLDIIGENYWNIAAVLSR